MNLIATDVPLLPGRNVVRTGYSLDYLNTDADIGGLLEGLRRRPRGSFCFYGAVNRALLRYPVFCTPSAILPRYRHFRIETTTRLVPVIRFTFLGITQDLPI